MSHQDIRNDIKINSLVTGIFQKSNVPKMQL